MDEREGGSLLAQTSSLSFSAITVGAACPVTTHSDALKLLERLNLPLLVYLRWLCHKTVTQPSVFWRSLISTTLLHLLPTQSPCLYANYSTSLGGLLTLSCPWPSELLSTPYLCPGYTAHVLRLRKELTPDSCCQSQRGISEDCPRSWGWCSQTFPDVHCLPRTGASTWPEQSRDRDGNEPLILELLLNTKHQKRPLTLGKSQLWWEQMLLTADEDIRLGDEALRLVISVCPSSACWVLGWPIFQHN